MSKICRYILLMLVVLAGACASSEELASDWSHKVEQGEYGWIDFNSGEQKNLDLRPNVQNLELRTGVVPEQSARCLEQLLQYNRVLSVEIRFLINEKGAPQDFIVMNKEAGACGRDAVRAMRDLTFRPGYRNGEKVKVVGNYTVRFAHRGARPETPKRLIP